MDGKGFAKMAKDTKLIDKKLTTTDVDMTFAKIKERTARRITFDQFMAGLAIFAEKKQCAAEAVHAKVAGSAGPILRGTQADAVRFHDDKSQYTGVYAQGGPTNVDANRGLDGLLDRSDADVRGVKTGGAAANVAAVTHQVAGIHLEEEKKAPAKKKKKAPAAGAAAAAQGGGGASSLQEVFNSFANGPEMDGKSFAKMSKDCKVLNKKCTATDIDLIFARNKERTARKINYQQFCAALAECAAKRGEDMAALEASILNQGGPVFSGTQAEAVRFHDDTD